MMLLFGLLMAGHAQGLPPDIRVNGSNIEAEITAAFVLPGAPVRITFVPRTLEESLNLTSDHGVITPVANGRWHYQPKQTGITELYLNTATHRLILRVFPLVPFDSATQTTLQGYPVGAYPQSARPGYRPPTGLLAVTADMQHERVSTHFTLNQFLTGTTAGPGQPHAALITTPLIETLEHLLSTLHNKGWSGTTLTILSGYRTPLHNAAVGGAPTSRHIYGDAVDVIADADGDGAMDDLNQDGRGDREDVEWLIAQFMRQAIPATMGGAGSYETQGPAGAFLHLDTRGTPAAWQR